MNSPVSCLPDPVQNMTKKKNKSARRVAQRVPRQTFAPVAMGGNVTKQRTNLPLVSGIGKEMLVQNFELIGPYPTQAGTPIFQANNLRLNAGIVLNFPWLSNIALNYSKFSWRFLRFIYVPAVSTTTAGSVWMDCHYDNADSAPTTMAQVMQDDSSSSGPAWIGGSISAAKAFSKELLFDQMVYVDVDCTKFTQNWFYCRKTDGATDADTIPAKFYYGNDSTIPAAVIPGNLYVAYICAFTEPVAPAVNV